MAGSSSGPAGGSSTLTHLNLSYNSLLGKAGMVAVAEALPHCYTLRHFNQSANGKVGTAAATALADTLVLPDATAVSSGAAGSSATKAGNLPRAAAFSRPGNALSACSVAAPASLEFDEAEL